MAEPTAHQLLTSVQPCPERNELLDGEKDQLLADASKCIEAMSSHVDGSGQPILTSHNKQRAEPAYVAAALALLLGFYRKKNVTINPTDAARAFAVEISRPSAVTQWIQQLEKLERASTRKRKRPTLEQVQQGIQKYSKEWQADANLCITLLHSVWDDWIEERAPALANKEHRPVGGGSAAEQHHYASVEQRKMALINELPYVELRARHEAQYHTNSIECGTPPTAYPYSAKFLRSLLPMAKDQYKIWLIHGVYTDVPPLPPPDHYLFKDAIEGARKIYVERFGGDLCFVRKLGIFLSFISVRFRTPPRNIWEKFLRCRG